MCGTVNVVTPREATSFDVPRTRSHDKSKACAVASQFEINSNIEPRTLNIERAGLNSGTLGTHGAHGILGTGLMFDVYNHPLASILTVYFL